MMGRKHSYKMEGPACSIPHCCSQIPMSHTCCLGCAAAVTLALLLLLGRGERPDAPEFFIFEDTSGWSFHLQGQTRGQRRAGQLGGFDFT